MKSEGYNLRTRAKQLQKDLQHHDLEWWRAHYRGGRYDEAWYQQRHDELQTRVDTAWAQAISAQEAAVAKELPNSSRYNYKQRDGTFIKKESNALVTIVFRRRREEVAPHVKKTRFT